MSAGPARGQPPGGGTSDPSGSDVPLCAPAWDEPLDVQDLMRRIPPTATVMGLFFNAALEAVRRARGKPLARLPYVSLRDYPLTEHVQLLVECAEQAYPDFQLRLALRRLGRDAFDAFMKSTVGWAVFGIAGRTWSTAAPLISRAYSLTGPVGGATVLANRPDCLVIGLRGIWNFADSYHVGVFEAAVDWYQKRGEVLVRSHSVADIDIHIQLESQLP